MSQWIDFAALRKQLNFAVVLESYGVQLTRKGTTDQYTGACPLPNHGEKKGTPFSANFAQGLFQCFGCKESGNIIDFAVLMAKADKRDGKAVRKIAASLRDKFVGKHEPEAESPKPAAPAAHTNPNQKRVVNEPLNFSLKTLEPDHPFFGEHRLTADTVAHFGLGFCKRGSLTGRIAVPLVDDVQQLVGYSGLVVDEKQVSTTNPRYLYPAPREVDDVLHVFDQTKFLYNGFRIGRSVKDLIVVQECHSVWSLWQGGFANVVGLMGNVCSDEQAEFVNLLTSPTGRVWFLTDRSTGSHACAASALPKLAAMRLSRWIQVEEERDIAPDHPLLAALPKR